MLFFVDNKGLRAAFNSDTLASRHGSPGSFVSQTTANSLINKLGKEIQNNASKVREFRCFNNYKIKINSTLKIHLSSENSNAQTVKYW